MKVFLLLAVCLFASASAQYYPDYLDCGSLQGLVVVNVTIDKTPAPAETVNMTFCIYNSVYAAVFPTSFHVTVPGYIDYREQVKAILYRDACYTFNTTFPNQHIDRFDLTFELLSFNADLTCSIMTLHF